MIPIDRGLWRCGAVLGATAVAAGAMGAHALPPELTARSVNAYHVAVRYQMYAALALLILATAAPGRGAALRRGGWLIAVGSLLFSGSIYALVFGGPSVFGPVTPLGGVLMIIGWGAIAFGLNKEPDRD